jgi:hypothetical protein
MQDMVLKHWTNDLGAIQQFQVYKTHHHQEWMSLVTCLMSSVDQEIEEIDNRANYVKDRLVLRTWDSLFSRAPERLERLKPIRELLKAVSQKNGSLTEADIKGLMDHLRRDIKQLPGHLVTLANELLVRGDAWVEHIHGGENPTHMP